MVKSKFFEKYGCKIEKYGGEIWKFEKYNWNIGCKMQNFGKNEKFGANIG